MTRRQPADPAPGPLERYVARFDDLFATLAQKYASRRYLEGLLLPTERNKTLTALANTEPVLGAQRKEVQGLQWFLSESNWIPEEINRRRVEIMLEDPRTAPTAGSALVVEETGDRKDGKATAHVGKQYLGGIGKIDNGVVSVSSAYADERLYYPIEVEPYTPAHHFEGGKADPPSVLPHSLSDSLRVLPQPCDAPRRSGKPRRWGCDALRFGGHRSLRWQAPQGTPRSRPARFDAQGRLGTLERLLADTCLRCLTPHLLGVDRVLCEDVPQESLGFF
jgi:hypothetical protein